MMPRVGLVILGACNRRSIESALERAGARVTIVDAAGAIAACDALVLPGVANFGFVAAELDRLGLRAPLLAAFHSGMPLLGICVGYQLLFDRSEEAPQAAGLGVFSGTVRRLQTPRVPHMGWNRVEPVRADGPLEGWAYFANAFAPGAHVADAVAITRDGPDEFAAAARRGSAYGVQFHPERSSAYGSAMLRCFVESSAVSYAR